jgi:hypothetical protein
LVAKLRRKRTDREAADGNEEVLRSMSIGRKCVTNNKVVGNENKK